MKRLYALLVAGALLLAGCSSSGSGSGASSTARTTGSSTPSSTPSSTTAAVSGSINVLAAASLTEAFTAIGKQFKAKYPGTSITFSFGASSDLATQITQGKPADVFASASTKNMDSVVSAGDASSPTNFVSNTLEIAVPPSNPAKITSVQDLAKSGVKVGVCDEAVPCGAVARKVFANAKITVKPAANLDDVKSTLQVVESGEVDAGLVYVTDVRSAGSKVKGVTIPASVNASTTYPIAALKDAQNTATANAFVAFVLSPTGQQALASAGFSKP